MVLAHLGDLVHVPEVASGSGPPLMMRKNRRYYQEGSDLFLPIMVIADLFKLEVFFFIGDHLLAGVSL
jgi:hypothetical protein